MTAARALDGLRWSTALPANSQEPLGDEVQAAAEVLQVLVDALAAQPSEGLATEIRELMGHAKLAADQVRSWPPSSTGS